MGEEVSMNKTLKECVKDLGLSKYYEKHEPLFYGLTIVYLCIALVAIIGNGLVLYVSYVKRNTGPLKILDGVIKSLAVADMLYGLIGMPCRVISNFYVGKYTEYAV
jgi:hypothetical protein